MKLTSESKFLLGIVLATAAILGSAVFFLSQPAKPIERSLLIPTEAHIQGNPEAKVYLVEFSDFQCPACRTFAPVVDELVAKNKDKLLFVYRHFPLPSHQYAKSAAAAAEAAGKQGKFWEMLKLLFANQEKFADGLWEELARSLSLDTDKFVQDMSSAEVTGIIARDETDARSLNLSSTPTFFLNGRKITDIQSLEQFRQIILAEISQ